MKKVRRGFTLPEILVTVTVVAVLAAVVVPAVTQYVSKGDTPATEQDLNQIRNAITAYIADTRQNPTSLYALTTNVGNLSTWKGPYLSTGVNGTTTVGTTGVSGNGVVQSKGLGISLGAVDNGTITKTTGYLTVSVGLTGSNTCQDLWNLDKYIDQGTNAATTGVSNVDSSTGILTWDNSTCITGASTAPYATLKIVTIGS